MRNDSNDAPTEDVPFDPTSQAADVLRAPVELKREMLLTEDEVASLFRVTVRTVERWRTDGLLSYRKIGRTIRFKWADLDYALDNGLRVRRRR